MASANYHCGVEGTGQKRCRLQSRGIGGRIESTVASWGRSYVTSNGEWYCLARTDVVGASSQHRDVELTRHLPSVC